jgi:hypothetical protein
MTECSTEERRETDVRQFWLGCILLSTVLSSTAASLGRQSGAAVIGRPLDVRVQVLLSADESAEALCLSADVNYGDASVPSSSVTVTPQRTAPDAEVSARIQTIRVVNEPFVYVTVRAGCNAPFSRQYVFLADPVTEPQRAQAPTARTAPTAVPALPAPVASARPAEESAVAEEVAAAATGAPRTARLRVGPPAAAGATAQNAAPRAPAPSVVRKPAPAAPPVASAPRLQLEPVDLSLSIERDPVLKLSLSMLSTPTDSEETRAAAGRLWKALNASPEDILRDAQKLTVLEAEIQGLRAEEERSKAAMAELSAVAERSRYLNWMVILLAALLLMALVALVVLWRRKGDAQGNQASTAWWSDASKAELAKSTSTAAAADKGRDPKGEIALDLDLDMDSGFGEPLKDGASAAGLGEPGKDTQAAMAGRDKKEFATSAIGGSRSVAAEELFDVQQQADFFVSLGEDEQAIQVLLNHLAESFEPSPLAYLDLFKLYHRLDRRDDYDRLRTEFNELFNAGAPPFDHYSHQSRGLESYETAFGRIQALWPEPRVLDVIEQSIFRDAGDGASEVFDLEAYRELLLLHAIAKDLVKRETENAPADFRHTKVQPLKAAGPVPVPLQEMNSAHPGFNGRNTEPMDAMPQASPRMGLDLDLSELDAYAEFEASLPEVSKPVEPTARTGSTSPLSNAGQASNLIDFEMLDFVRPEDDSTDGSKNKGS